MRLIVRNLFPEFGIVESGFAQSGVASYSFERYQKFVLIQKHDLLISAE